MMEQAQRKQLRFRHDGTFHILMVSDLHGGDKYMGPQRSALHILLEETHPDVVLFGGDMVISEMFENRECDETSLKRFLSYTLSELEQKQIPWAHVFGNHDTESPVAKTSFQRHAAALIQQSVYESFSSCISGRNDEELHGVSNYVLPVWTSDGNYVAYNLFAIDSLTSLADAAESFGITAEDMLFPNNLLSNQNTDGLPLSDQVSWYYQTSKACEKTAGRKIPAIMWMHIPLQEMRLISDNRESCRFEGIQNEGIGCSVYNTGLFMACKARGDVRGIFFGHDHRNDFSGELLGITLGYDGALYDMRRSHDLTDNRGGREIILYEDGSPIQTRQIRLKDYHLPVEEPLQVLPGVK